MAGHAHCEVREVIRSWHAVIHVRASNQLTRFIVDRLLQKGLTHALGNAAMDLPSTIIGLIKCKIVHSDKLHDLRDPCIGINFDLQM